MDHLSGLTNNEASTGVVTHRGIHELEGRNVHNSGVPKTDYSKIADYYDKVRPSLVDYWLSKIIEYGGIEADCNVLDVGCGTGRYPLGMLAATICRICGLEPSIEMLRQAIAKDKTRRVLWVCGDGQRLPFKDSSFDCVYMTLVIHHIEDRESFLRESHRVLRKGGSCVIVTNSHSRIRRHVLRYFPGIVAIDLKRFPSISSLKRAMTMIGFREVHHHILRQDRGRISTEEYIERVRNKYVSTLTLFGEDEFQRGLSIFKRKIRAKYGNHIEQLDKFVLVVGRK
jgi:SAM-dependent methyltransferase